MRAALILVSVLAGCEDTSPPATHIEGTPTEGAYADCRATWSDDFGVAVSCAELEGCPECSFSFSLPPIAAPAEGACRMADTRLGVRDPGWGGSGSAGAPCESGDGCPVADPTCTFQLGLLGEPVEATDDIAIEATVVGHIAHRSDDEAYDENLIDVSVEIDIPTPEAL